MTHSLSPSQVLQKFCIAQDLISYRPQPSALSISCAARRFMVKRSREPCFPGLPTTPLVSYLLLRLSPNTPRSKCLSQSAYHVFSSRTRTRTRTRTTLRYSLWRLCPPELRGPVQWLQHGLCRAVLFPVHAQCGVRTIVPRRQRHILPSGSRWGITGPFFPAERVYLRRGAYFPTNVALMPKVRA